MNTVFEPYSFSLCSLKISMLSTSVSIFSCIPMSIYHTIYLLCDLHEKYLSKKILRKFLGPTFLLSVAYKEMYIVANNYQNRKCVCNQEFRSLKVSYLK